jgi:tRNA pseudouridine55 synthase
VRRTALDAVPWALVVDKPRGPTSHDVVAMARRSTGVRRIGHAGTLDPPATGVLVLLGGPATRLAFAVQALTKRYVAEIVLGTSTTTLDDTGDVVEVKDATGVTLEEALSAARGLEGVVVQIPPMVSARKVGGRRLHELARAGTVVEREARPVQVWRFALERGPEAGVLRADVVCSSGTYVRVLARDLGERLGVGAHLRKLRRTAVGSLTAETACSPGDLGERERPDPAAVLVDYRRAVVDAATARRVATGGSVLPEDLELAEPDPWPQAWPRTSRPDLVSLVDPEGALVALHRLSGDGRASEPLVVLRGAG